MFRFDVNTNIVESRTDMKLRRLGFSRKSSDLPVIRHETRSWHAASDISVPNIFTLQCNDITYGVRAELRGEFADRFAENRLKQCSTFASLDPVRNVGE